MNSVVKKKNWYQDWFGQDYVKVYPHRDEKEARLHVDFVIRALSLKKNQHILDLGCGGGCPGHKNLRVGCHVESDCA